MREIFIAESINLGYTARDNDIGNQSAICAKVPQIAKRGMWRKRFGMESSYEENS